MIGAFVEHMIIKQIVIINRYSQEIFKSTSRAKRYMNLFMVKF